MEDHNLPLVKTQLKTNSKCVFKSTQMSLFFFSQAAFVPGGQSKPHLKAALSDHVSQSTKEQTPHTSNLSTYPRQSKTRHRQYIMGRLWANFDISLDNVPLNPWFWNKFWKRKVLKFEVFKCSNSIKNKFFSGNDSHFMTDIYGTVSFDQ